MVLGKTHQHMLFSTFFASSLGLFCGSLSLALLTLCLLTMSITMISLKFVDPFFKLPPSVIVQEDGVEMWRCNNGQCISLEKKRDGRPDCEDR